MSQLLGWHITQRPRVLRQVQISLPLLYCRVYTLHWALRTCSLHLASHTTVFGIIQGVSFIVAMTTAAVIRCPCRWGLRVRYCFHAQWHDTDKTEHTWTCGLCPPKRSGKFCIFKLLAPVLNRNILYLCYRHRICTGLFIFEMNLGL